MRLLGCMHPGCAAQVPNLRKFCVEHNPLRKRADAEADREAENYLVAENKRLRARVAELEGVP